MTIKVGERLPNAALRLVTPDGPKPVETKDYFAGKTVVLFGLPGAFTPTCHKNHLPGFIVNELLARRQRESHLRTPGLHRELAHVSRGRRAQKGHSLLGVRRGRETHRRRDAKRRR